MSIVDHQSDDSEDHGESDDSTEGGADTPASNELFNWYLAPDRQPRADSEKEQLLVANLRISTVASNLREEFERNRTKSRQPKDQDRYATFDNSALTTSMPISPRSSSMDQAAYTRKCQNVIIFDWDDTLFPTWHLTEVIEPSLQDEYGELSESSVFYKPMKAHTKLIERVLTAASSIAQVYIVTLGRRPWVESSSERFLPGLDIPCLLKKLGIRVYYAREHLGTHDRWFAASEGGVNPFMLAKRNAFKKCVRKARRSSGLKNINAIAVGDSRAEIEAMQEVVWSDDVDENRCKTVHFMSDPSLKALTSELQVFLSWMSKMVAYDKDIDIDMERLDATSIQKMLQSV